MSWMSNPQKAFKSRVEVGISRKQLSLSWDLVGCELSDCGVVASSAEAPTVRFSQQLPESKQAAARSAIVNASGEISPRQPPAYTAVTCSQLTMQPCWDKLGWTYDVESGEHTMAAINTSVHCANSRPRAQRYRLTRREDRWR